MPDARRRVGAGVVLGSLLGALLVVAPGGSDAAFAVDHKPWGRLKAPNQTLEAGCSKHFFRYRVNPPRDEWLAEMLVMNPDGDAIYSTAQDSEFHKNRGKIRYTVCSASTSYGRHKLRMRITWYEDDPASTPHTGWVKPSYFRMRRP
jgi:hypothetical protein